MKRIKQRLLSLAMTGALLLGFTLPEAFAASAKSSNESNASETQETASEKSGKKQSKKKDADAQAEEKSSKATDETAEKAKSSEDKASSGKSEKSEKKTDSNSKKVSLSLSISKPGGLSASGGAWQVDPEKVSALTLSWKCKGECDSFEVSVSGGVYSASTEKKSAKIPVSGLSAGKYTATVKAIRDGKTVAREKLSFQIVASSVDELAEESEAESVGNGAAEESSMPQAQPEEDMPAEAGDTVEEAQDTAEKQAVEQTQDTAEEEPAENNPVATEEPPVEEVQDATEEQPAEQAQDATVEQPVEQAQDAEVEQNVEQPQDTTVEQPVEQAQDAEVEQTIEQPQDVTEEPAVEQAQGTTQEPSTDVSQDPTQAQSTDESQDAPSEQPDQEEIDVIGDVLVEEANDAAIDRPAGEECLDLSEPDIQTPQEDPVELQAVAEEPLPEVTVDTLDEPEIALPEIDEALDLGDPSSEAALLEDGSISANAGDDKAKADNKLTLSVKGAEGLSVIDGAVHVNPAQASAVTLVWSFGGSCDEYVVSVSGGVYDKTTRKSQLKLPVKSLSSGQYTVTVAANKDGKALSSARLSFIVDDADSEGETSGLAITVASPQGLLITEGVYQVDPAQADALTLAWQYGGECDAYDVSVSGDVYSGRTEEDTVTVPLSDLAAGTYTVTVVALNKGETVAQAQLSFKIPSQDEQSGDDPGKDGQQGDQPQGGGKRSGGQKGGTSKDSEGQEADQGFRVTPGEALISTHTSGNRDMRLYGAITLTLDGESAMDVLTLGDTALDIRLSDGGLFTASIDGTTLTLVPEGDAQAWLLNGYALKTLARSGVTYLRLTLDDMTVEFPTLPGLSGSQYGALCAAGRTSRDYSYAVSSNGCTVTVAGQSFQLTAEGELV